MSNNGWPNDPALEEVGVPGVKDTGPAHAGVVADLFRLFIADFHATVERLVTINGFRSYALNKQSGGIETSNHRSGTAFDLNGYKHPYEPSAAKPYNDGFTDEQTAQIRRLLAKYGGTIKWGMDFPRGYRDAMHFEIRGNAGAVEAVANRISGVGSVPTVPNLPSPEGITPINPSLLEEDDMPVFMRSTDTTIYIIVPGQPKRGLSAQEWALWVRLGALTPGSDYLEAEIDIVARTMESARDARLAAEVDKIRPDLNTIAQEARATRAELLAASGTDLDTDIAVLAAKIADQLDGELATAVVELLAKKLSRPL